MVVIVLLLLVCAARDGSGQSEGEDSVGKILMITAVSGFLAVAIGAFGTHVLQGLLSDRQLAWMATAQRYQLFHTVALLGLCALVAADQRGPDPAAGSSRLWRWIAAAFVAGLLLFSGTLYGMALTGNTSLAWLVPIGGLSFLVGWLLLLFWGYQHWRRQARIN